MADQAYKCGKCGGQMLRGFISERSDSASRFVARWIEGEPVQAELWGFVGDNVDVAGRRQFLVRSLKCEKCGFLELYAV